MKDNSNFNKIAIHDDFLRKDPYNSISMPVYNALSFEFDTAEEMELAFSSQSNGFVYSRVSNPTVQYFENKVKNLTSALSVTALNSGMAAISNALFSIAYTGSNIVTSKNLFGNTYSFFQKHISQFWS